MNISKIIGASVEGLSKKFVPKGAVKYNLVSGATAKNGKFEVVSLFDGNNNLLKRVISYPELGIKRVRNYTRIGSDKLQHLEISEKIFENGKKNGEIAKKIMTNNETGVSLMFNETLSPTPNFGDLHEVSLLKAGKNKKGLQYYTFWNGEKPIIEKYINVDEEKKLSEAFLEYLPCAVSTDTKSRVAQKFTHMAKIQEQKQQLQGMVPTPRRVAHSKLNQKRVGFRTGHMKAYTGKIYVSKILTNSYDMLNTLAHEYQHAKDFSELWRLDFDKFNKIPIEKLKILEKRFPGVLRFAKHSMKKGDIASNSLKERDLRKLEQARKTYVPSDKNREQYRNNLLEIRARETGKNESNCIGRALNDVLEFIA